MKKILMITYDSPNIDRRIYLFADTLQSIGYDVSILTPHAEVENGFEHIDVINLYNKSIVNIIKPSLHSKNILRKYLPIYFFNILKKIYLKISSGNEHIPYLNEMINKATSIKADFYISNDLPTLPIAKACIEKNRGLFIYDAHEFYLGQDVLSSDKIKTLSKVETSIYPEIDFLITVNNDIRNLFFKNYGQKRSEIIYNATKCTNSEKKYLHDLIDISRDRKILLYQGAFIEKRRLEDLIYISKFLKNCTLVMLGWGGNENKLKELANDLDVLDKKAYFIPKISQKELISYSSSATLGVIPYDGFDLNTKYCTPNKLFEFICAELPTIYNSNLVTVSGIINKYKFGFSIDISNHEDCAKEIDSLVNNDEQLLELRANVKKSKNNLNWDIEKEKLINIFRLLDENKKYNISED